MTNPVRSRLLVAVVALLGLFGGPALRAQLATFTKSELTIVTAGGKHRFAIEEATTRSRCRRA